MQTLRPYLRWAFAALAALVLIAPAIARAQDEADDEGPDPAEPDARLAVVKVQTGVARLEDQVYNLREKYLSEIETRDVLLLERRFREAKEYYVHHVYDEAAEILYGVLQEPAAPRMEHYYEACHALAESLYQLKRYDTAKVFYQRVYAAGPDIRYFALSLTRLIELAIIDGDYERAREYYLDYLDRVPRKSADGSQATYLIGKAFYLRGDRDKARQLFESIPENSDYGAIARYFSAVMDVEDGNLEGAIEKFETLKEIFKYEFVDKKRLYELVHISLGRLYYELDDYARATKEYFTVPPESTDYPEVLYEAMWVYLTRNERILQALMRERSRFAGLKYEWDEFEQSLETPPRDIFARMNSDLIAEVNDALDEIESLFAEIEAALDKLKDEAVTAFDKLNKAAPESPLVPEAEVLMGYVLSQMEEFDDAENWFKNLKAKYSVYDARVRQMQDEVRTQDDEVALIEDVVAHHAGEPDASTEGLPAEVKTWLAEKEGVGEALAVMDKLTEQSKSIDQMRDMMGDVEKALAVARVEASFPNLARAQQRAAGLKTISIALLAAIDEARGRTAEVADAGLRRRFDAKLDAEQARIGEMRSFLDGIDAEVETKRNRRLDEFAAAYRQVGTPVQGYRYENATLATEVKRAAADSMRGKLQEIGKELEDIVVQSSLGEIDVNWARTQQYNRDIGDILREQEKEIRRFREQLDAQDDE